jgi:hypothetical protein
MQWPSFLIIGAYKSGTTALFNYFCEHPEVFMSPVKETNFFALEGQPERLKPSAGDRKAFHKFAAHSITERSAYEKLFGGITKEKAAGEASPAYLCSPEAAARIHRYAPRMKLIAILRNPVERAFSAFVHARRRGQEPIADFGEALRQEDRRIAQDWAYIYHYKAAGFYADQLQRYYDRFDRGQIKILISEDLRENPQRLLSEVFRFVGVDDSFVPDLSIRHNVGGLPRFPRVHRLVEVDSRVRRVLRHALPRRARPWVSRKEREWNLVKPSFPPRARRELTALYRGEISRLQNLISRDLSCWLSAPEE